MERYFPFYKLGFVRNPFGAVTPAEWAEIAVLPDGIAGALAAGFDHLQILGEKGRGKTTILHALAAHFRDQGEHVAYERVPVRHRRFRSDLVELDRFLLDEAQRLGPLERRRLFRAARRGLRLVIASHRDHARGFGRHDLPLISFWLEEVITPEHVRAALDSRLAFFALDEGPRVHLAPDAISHLWDTYGTDLRAVERLLYDIFQALDGPGTLTANDLIRLSRPTPPPGTAPNHTRR